MSKSFQKMLDFLDILFIDLLFNRWRTHTLPFSKNKPRIKPLTRTIPVTDLYLNPIDVTPIQLEFWTATTLSNTTRNLPLIQHLNHYTHQHSNSQIGKTTIKLNRIKCWLHPTNSSFPWATTLRRITQTNPTHFLAITRNSPVSDQGTHRKL